MEIKVFVSYSHKDEAYLKDDNLLGYLKALEGEGVSFWWDDAIVTGDDWNEEIKARIKDSHIALVLISQSYLESTYIKNEEIADFLERRQDKGLVIFPIILSDCKWFEHEWLKRLQLPAGGKPLEEHSSDPEHRGMILREIRQDLEKQVQKIKESNEDLAPTRINQNLDAWCDLDREFAIIFVHDSSISLGGFPRFLAIDPKMRNWNIFSFRYPSRIGLLDLIQERNRTLKITSQALRTACSVPPLDKHRKIALIAHSIAGLIVQLALLDSDDFARRVSDVILFGTPSKGLPESSLYYLLRNLKLNPDGEFIKELRQRWDDKFSQNLLFNLITIAGDADQRVQPWSSLDPFLSSQKRVLKETVHGDHFQIIGPSSKDDPSVQIVIRELGSAGHQSQPESGR